MTEWRLNHPGGPERIQLAAGKDLGPFWSVYGNHLEDAATVELLQQMQVGVLDPADVEKEASATASARNSDDPFHNDPERSPLLNFHSIKPCNAEPPTPLLTDTFLTPSELFYVRNHLPVPDIKPDEYTLEVDATAGGGKKIHLTLADLRDAERFQHHEIYITLQCGGGRRREFNELVRPVRGLAWDAAISTATWKGVLLRDLMKEAGADLDTAHARGVNHVVSQGADTDATNGEHFQTSVPVDQGLGHRDVLVAFEMNGKDIPRDHGYPVRLLVPGNVGARSVKWLSRVSLDSEEPDSHWQRRDYKILPSWITDPTEQDWAKLPAMQELAVTSAITVPPAGSRVNGTGGFVHAKGYAYSGAGHDVTRVEVSADGGETWHVADLKPSPAGTKSRSGSTDVRTDGHMWAWRQWEADIPVPALENDGVSVKAQLVCRAIDTGYNRQPENIGNIWNVRGLLNNSYHRIEVIAESDM